MVDVKRGDICLIDLNPVIGTEQSGIRHAVILQTDKANKVSPHTIIAPLTTKIRNAILPSHIVIESGSFGLNQNSVILCEQIRAINKKRILKYIGFLPPDKIAELDRALIEILDIKFIFKEGL
jgi:mRNA interferase MazF